ncbi:hypothetical protein X548_08625 [Stenotrophomonas maltophilia 5BA-I-2]|nr:hypothetical protein X548_08625 [Stenotrophomonas maltophilia 5BA-I-2]
MIAQPLEGAGMITGAHLAAATVQPVSSQVVVGIVTGILTTGGGGACDERERDTADHRRGERKLIAVGKRPLGTFPETAPYPASL